MGKKKLLVYLNFVIACLVVIAIFITAKTYVQLALATALYPPLVYFAFKIFFPKSSKVRFKKIKIANQPTSVNEPKSKGLDLGIVDLDKRTFLKLIGMTGLSFFFFSILTRKIEFLLFERLVKMGVAPENTAENKIKSSNSPSTEDYQIAQIDNNEISFYGFTDEKGKWFIMKEDSSAGSFRYTRGESDFARNWTNRENLKYDYFYHVFP